jgi:hypothetical protein
MKIIALLLMAFAIGLTPITVLATVRGADTLVVVQKAPACSSYRWSI